MRVYGTSRKCNRWFFKFNGNECSGPMTIEAAVYNHWPSGSPNLHHHRSFEGYCENIPQGRVTVELWVGQCHGGYTLGDAHTGWQSVSRIMIEEVSRAQFWLIPSFSYKEWWTILYCFIILALKIFRHHWYPKVRNVLLLVTNISFFSKHFPYFLCDCDTR